MDLESVGHDRTYIYIFLTSSLLRRYIAPCFFASLFPICISCFLASLFPRYLKMIYISFNPGHVASTVLYVHFFFACTFPCIFHPCSLLPAWIMLESFASSFSCMESVLPSASSFVYRPCKCFFCFCFSDLLLYLNPIHVSTFLRTHCFINWLHFFFVCTFPSMPACFLIYACLLHASSVLLESFSLTLHVFAFDLWNANCLLWTLSQ